MDTVASEVSMTVLWPEKNRQTTGRINTVDVLMKTHGANELSKLKSTNEYVINYSHEEIATPIAQDFIKSYKDLPAAFYQVGTKFRNEARAKSGLLRGREFLMKDGYSFHSSEEDFEQYYDEMKTVYMKIFKELGLGDQTVEALASGWDFTEKYSHEYQTFCDAGEDVLFIDDSTGIAYNEEIAPAKTPEYGYTQQLGELEDVYGEDVVSVAKLCDFLNIPVEQTIKTMLYRWDNNQLYAVAVRGDYEVNEIKLTKALWIKRVTLLSDEEIMEYTWAERGYAGIVNLPEAFQPIYDDALSVMTNFESGTNKTHYHTVNINWERDLPRPERFYDIKTAKEWDLNPQTWTAYRLEKACEVGNIFPLETKYTDAFEFKHIWQNNTPEKIIMGCYGIGVSRLMWVIVEKFHDEKGILWPENIAPYTHVIIGIWDEWTNIANTLYAELLEKWVDVCLDDRDASPGFKFKDADLIGYPYQIVIWKKTLEQGNKCELVTRKTGEKELVNLDEIVSRVI